jgi:peptidoglycan/LPS O-acetylase OafA/YrhL
MSAASFHLGYRPALNGLRAVAVLAVMAFHFEVPAARHGFLGVDVFFVLSGFLITSILAEEWSRKETISFRRFYLRRILRLYPALLLLLLVMSFTAAPRAYLVSSLVYVTNWMVALHWQPFYAPLIPLWSLSVEEQYYILWPLLLALLLRHLSPRRALLVPLVLAGLSAGWTIVAWQASSDWMRVWYGTDTNAGGLLIGSTLALVAGSGMLPRWERIRHPLNVATALSFLFAGYLVVGPPLQGVFFAVGGLGAELATAVLIARLVFYPLPALRRLLEFRPLVVIGVMSYGLYLWHMPIKEGLISVTGQASNRPLVVGSEFVLTFLVAGLSYRYLERPLLRLKDRLGAIRT